MEPYRAFIGDQLPDRQLTYGFQMQSLFVGAGITLANFSLFLFQDWFSSPVDGAGLCSTATETISAIPTWVYYSFFLGAVASMGTILWSVLKTPEYPPSPEELEHMKSDRKDKSLIKLAFDPLVEIYHAIGAMPKMMWKLAAVYFFQWYALFVYWQFLPPMLRTSLFGISNEDSDKFDSIMVACRSGVEISSADTTFAHEIQSLSEQALAQTGLMNGTYNMVTMVMALALVPIAKKYSSRNVYVISLMLTGIAMLSMPYIKDQYALLLPMFLFGIGWAAMMGIPYAMVSQVIPEDRRGVYMGIVNMMIVIPMLIQTVSFGFIIKNGLGNNAVNAILFGGVFFMIAGFLALRLKLPKEDEKITI